MKPSFLKLLMPLAILCACSLGVNEKNAGATITTNTKTASIAGHVYGIDSVVLARQVAASGNAVDQALVTLTMETSAGIDTIGSYRTSMDGAFRFDSLLAGVYTLKVVVPSTATQIIDSIVLAPGQALERDVSIGDTSTHNTFQASAGWRIVSPVNYALTSNASWDVLESHGNRILGVYPGGACAMSPDGLNWSILAVTGELFFLGGDSIALWSSWGWNASEWQYSPNGSSWKTLTPVGASLSNASTGRVKGFHQLGDKYYRLDPQAYVNTSHTRNDTTFNSSYYTVALTEVQPLKGLVPIDSMPPVNYDSVTREAGGMLAEGSWDNGKRILQFMLYSDTAWDINPPYNRYIVYTDSAMKLHQQPGPSVGFVSVVGDSLGWLALDSTGALNASVDGLTWTPLAKPAGATIVNFVAVGDGKFLVGTNVALSFTSTKSPGTWTSEYAPDARLTRSAVFHKGHWYVGGVDNYMLRKD